MSYRASVIAALLALLATPASAGNVIDPYTLFPPPPAPTGIAYKNAGNLASITAGGGRPSTATVDMPSDLEAGSLLIAVTMSRPVTGATTAASGWTQEAACENTWLQAAVSIFSHLVTTPGSEPSSIDFEATENVPFTAIILQFTGGTSVDAITENSSGSTATSPHITANVTPTNSTGIIISAVGTEGWTYSFTSTPATTVTSIAVPDTNYYGLVVSYAPSSGTTAQGSVSVSTSDPVRGSSCSVAIH